MSRLKEMPFLYFYTFTFDSRETLEQCWADYNASWNRFRTAARKKYGAFNYVRVLEPQPGRNYPHIHVITDMWFQPSWMGPEAVSAGFGYQMDGKRIEGPEALSYVAKYLTKEWPTTESIQFRKANRCRIISFSRGLLSPALRSDGWKLLLRAADFDVCLDHILVDYTWRTDVTPKIEYEQMRENGYEIHVVFESIVMPGTPPIRQLTPDDFVV
jgi:hypothetical protein